ncbi:hypothetical protein SH611_14415 [Geminicoccaceae bacterium 1502E]|nr:hypothetical protein [Geminicoccaceae bacterium 1502E]
MSSYAGLLLLFLVGVLKERRACWPFGSKPNANWPSGIVGYFTLSVGISSRNVLVGAALAWTYMVAIILLIIYGVLGARRNWF